MKDELITSGSAATIDGVNLKAQGRHFVDFTVHHMHLTKPKSILQKARFSIALSTVLLIEGLNVRSGANNRPLLDENLGLSYGVYFNSMQKKFTIVTDGEEPMARMVKSSVSSCV